jgi:NADH:ubiquinone oxidoreductase subunit 6 (subunit J)
VIVELIAIGLVISACLAIYLDEAIYSVAALAGALILMAIIYALNGAIFAAVFQFAVSIGTLSVLFLSAEMLSEKPDKPESVRKIFTVIIAALLLSVPVIFLSVMTSPTYVSSDVSFAEALWNLRAIDVVLQGLVMMTVAIGAAIILHEKKEDKN